MGVIMNGSAVLAKYYTIVFKYNASQDRFVELSRNF